MCREKVTLNLDPVVASRVGQAVANGLDPEAQKTQRPRDPERSSSITAKGGRGPIRGRDADLTSTASLSHFRHEFHPFPVIARQKTEFGGVL